MTYKNLIVIAVLLIIGLVTWQIGCNSKPQVPKEPKSTDAYNKTVDSLKSLIADQVAVQQSYDMQISQLNDSIVVLNEVIRKNELSLTKIKARKNEKIAAVSKYSSLDITKFLSDRYKDSIR
jgi:TolA-binding protein